MSGEREVGPVVIVPSLHKQIGAASFVRTEMIRKVRLFTRQNKAVFRRSIYALIVGATMVPGSAWAQGAGPRAVSPLLPPRHLGFQMPVEANEPWGGILGDGSKDFRYEGLTGGVIGGGALALLAILWCNQSDEGCETGEVLIAAVGIPAVGGILGALIGGAIPKRD